MNDISNEQKLKFANKEVSTSRYCRPWQGGKPLVQKLRTR